ncbi:MAG: SsrA-binding protein SmpB [Candidatus Borkfalkiaceae bacterium]|nr:SsrA-binding protein SmpB [Christensenellaceae bacterium]
MEDKVICLNRAASHEYFILERIEAGIALDGGEVKSLRMGNCNLRDSFCSVHNGEMLIRNMFISVYDKATAFNEKNARRDRKLLLHRTEILKLKEKVEQKGLTLVPLKMYFKNALIKIELGLCRGKHTYDKKQSLKEKDLKREKERIMKNY